MAKRYIRPVSKIEPQNGLGLFRPVEKQEEEEHSGGEEFRQMFHGKLRDLGMDPDKILMERR